MKYTKTMTCLGLIATIGSAQAVTIAITGAANSTSVGSSSVGTFAATELVADDTANAADEADRTITYTISGLTIDNDGTADDSVTINFVVTTDGQNIQTSGTTQNGWLSSGGPRLDANGESLTIAFESISATLTGGGSADTLTFDGFTAVSWGSWGSGDTSVVNGVSNVAVGDDSKKTQTTSGSSLFAQYDTTANTGADADAAGAWRPEGWDFGITASVVPEPSSTALLGLGGLALILRRRK